MVSLVFFWIALRGVGTHRGTPRAACDFGVFSRAERDSARRNRAADDGKDPLRVLGQVQPREA